MTTGELIVAARQSAGMTRGELAERTAIPLRTLEKIEQGVVVEPKLVDVAAIASVLGLTCADFLPTSSPPPPPTPVGRPPAAKPAPKRKPRG